MTSDMQKNLIASDTPRKTWDIHGGIHPPENKHQSMQRGLENAPLPTEVVLPLNQHIGAPAEPIVNVGDKVLTGQCIAAAVGFVSAPVHASISGTVVAIEDRVLPHPSGQSGPCIIIESDGRDEWIELHPLTDYLSMDKMDLAHAIRDAGITGMGGAGFPTAVKVNPKANKHIETLIINGTECEPYITADDMIMQTYADEIVAGAEVLAHLLSDPAEILIGIEDNKPDAIAAMRKACQNSRAQVVVFPTKYPSGGEKQLIQILTGKEVPSGGLPADIGITMQNVGTARAVWRAVSRGEPLINRITTLVGEALTNPGNVEVRLGTPINELLEAHGFQQDKCYRLIMGGPMMGFSLETPTVPVVKTSNCIIAASASELPNPPPAQACIRCGMCAEACPASLLPQQLFWYAQAQDSEKLEAHNLFDCIECGACSYVCPSNIPLVQYYRASKASIKHARAEKEKSDHARQRFEFRQERIAKAEAEKEAKRIARQKAAEEAKKKLAAAKAATPGSTEKATSPEAEKADMVAAAMARVKAKQSSPEELQAKAERALSSAQSRLEKAQAKLAEARQEGASDERLEMLAAQIKQIEVRVHDAEKKLAEAKQAPATAAVASTKPAPGENDPVAAAIARAQAKAAMNPQEKLQANIESLQNRLQKARAKADAAATDNSPTADALMQGVNKLESKLAEAQVELQKVQQLETTKPAAIPNQAADDPAAAAIERAKAKAAANASMSAEEKLKEQLSSLENRLAKARQRLAQAEADNDPNTEALRTGVEKMQAKLAQTKAELEQMTE